MARWEKGQSGNPSGRPKGSGGVAVAIRKALADETRRDSFGERVLELAHEGNPKALEMVRYALDGPVTQKLDVKTVVSELTGQDLLDFIQRLEDAGVTEDGE